MTKTAEDLRALFWLDPDTIFLNHGSFGATPRSVLDRQFLWQRQMERQPVRFMSDELPERLRGVRQELATLVEADAAGLVLVPNVTFGVNWIARSLDLQPGDEVLASDQEYGACDTVWEFICERRGAHYIRQPLPLPLPDAEAVIARLWEAVTPRTRLIFLSHITSATAQRLPLEAICARARQEGILTLIDGAHAPGQLDLNLTTLGADFYTGNCHKWLLAPKNVGFVWVTAAQRQAVTPLIISWGWLDQGAFADRFAWNGTQDPSPALTISEALEFRRYRAWPELRPRCHQLLRATLTRLEQTLDQASLYTPACLALPPQMGAVRLPARLDPIHTKQALLDHYHIEIPITSWGGTNLVRLSVQGYTSQADCDALVQALAELARPGRR